MNLTAISLFESAKRKFFMNSVQRGLIQLSRHDLRRVQEKFSSSRFEKGNSCLTDFGILSPKTSDFKFVDMMTPTFWR